MATLAMSGQYGLVGTDWIRFHTITVEEFHSIILVTADTGAPLAELPRAYMTSGHMANVAARCGVPVLMGAVPNDAIASIAHKHKLIYGLDGFAAKWGMTADQLASLKGAYAGLDDIEIAA